MGECFFWYRPTRVVPDQRPLNGCVLCVLLLTVHCLQWYITLNKVAQALYTVSSVFLTLVRKSVVCRLKEESFELLTEWTVLSTVITNSTTAAHYNYCSPSARMSYFHHCVCLEQCRARDSGQHTLLASCGVWLSFFKCHRSQSHPMYFIYYLLCNHTQGTNSQIQYIKVLGPIHVDKR